MGAKKDPKKDAKTPAKTPKKKEGGGGKAKKKKWSKGKSRDKLNNLVLFDKVGTLTIVYAHISGIFPENDFWTPPLTILNMDLTESVLT